MKQTSRRKRLKNKILRVEREQCLLTSAVSSVMYAKRSYLLSLKGTCDDGKLEL